MRLPSQGSQRRSSAAPKMSSSRLTPPGARVPISVDPLGTGSVNLSCCTFGWPTYSRGMRPLCEPVQEPAQASAGHQPPPTAAGPEALPARGGSPTTAEAPRLGTPSGRGETGGRDAPVGAPDLPRTCTPAVEPRPAGPPRRHAGWTPPPLPAAAPPAGRGVASPSGRVSPARHRVGHCEASVGAESQRARRGRRPPSKGHRATGAPERAKCPFSPAPGVKQAPAVGA